MSIVVGLLLLLLANVGATKAFFYLTPQQNSRLHSLLNFEVKIENHVKTNAESKTGFLRKFTSRFLSIASARSGGDREDYINNPLPALVLTRRLAEDWTSLASMARANLGPSLAQLGLGAIQWPSYQQVDSAALTIMRSQWTYSLDIDSLANGVVTGNHFSHNVTAADCFYVAKMYYNHQFIEEALQWLKQALYKTLRGDSSVSNQSLMQYFAVLKCISGDSDMYQKTLARLIKEGGQEVKIHESYLNLFTDVSKLGCTDRSDISGYYYNSQDELEEHRNLCNREETLSNTLRCRYVHYGQPHLRLQPFKLEELQIDPPVLRFYDVITDREAEILRENARSVMTTAGTVASDGNAQFTTYRTSEVAWLYPGDSDVNDRLQLRMAELTQLNIYTSEFSQISRYSISGEYLPHHDYMTPKMPFDHDRIATLMFYLNDVKLGGNTVFLNWNLTLSPVKNSAVLWFNYSPNGKEDEKSLHSGCPVLQGTKWVLNKWFMNYGNEFMKPCGLTPDDSFMKYYLK